MTWSFAKIRATLTLLRFGSFELNSQVGAVNTQAIGSVFEAFPQGSVRLERPVDRWYIAVLPVESVNV